MKSENGCLYLEKQNKKELKYRAYDFSSEVVKFVLGLPNQRAYWVLGDQLLRSATSIGANVIEAQAASSRKDFAQFYSIALKSANETKYWLCLLRDNTAVDKSKIAILLEESVNLANILGASLVTIRVGKRN